MIKNSAIIYTHIFLFEIFNSMKNEFWEEKIYGIGPMVVFICKQSRQSIIYKKNDLTLIVKAYEIQLLLNSIYVLFTKIIKAKMTKKLDR